MTQFMFGTPKKNKMKRFVIQEISTVDKPAQEGALATIIKRKDDGLVDRIILHSVCAGSVTDLPGTRAYSKALDVHKNNNDDVNLIRKSWPLFAALDASLRSTVSDTSLDEESKINLMRSSVGEFLSVAKQRFPRIEGYLEAALQSGERSRSESEMNLSQVVKKVDALSRQLESLVKSVRTRKNEEEFDDTEKAEEEDLMEQESPGDKLRRMLGEKSRKADVTGEDEFKPKRRSRKANPFAEEEEAEKGDYEEDEMPVKRRSRKADPFAEEEEAEKAGDNPFAEEEEAEKGGAEDEDEILARYSSKAEEEDEDEAEKVMDTTEDEGLTTTEGEEEDVIAAGSSRPIGKSRKRVRLSKQDRVHILKVGGRIIRKSKVGSEMFEFLKAQQSQVETLAKRAREERRQREIMEYAKVVEKKLAHLPGTSLEKAHLLYDAARTLSASQRRLLSKMLRAGDGGLSAAFRSLGHTGNSIEFHDVAKSRNSFEKRVNAIKARDNCSHTEALRKARREYPDEFAASQGH